jgi:Leucine-rich repeat (LRR) protein
MSDIHRTGIKDTRRQYYMMQFDCLLSLGTLPSQLGALHKATIVMVWANDFSGTIPDSLGDLSSLTNLDIGYNCLTSTIPSSMSKLSAITLLGMTYHHLS